MERLDAIKELIKRQKVSDQMELIHLLKETYGITTNQATVSRDLRKLQVVKKEHKGVRYFELPNVDVRQEILKLAIIDILHNESMIVIKTQAGLAAFVADCVDGLHDGAVLGSLAGENTVFVAPTSTKAILKTYLALCVKLAFKG